MKMKKNKILSIISGLAIISIATITSIAITSCKGNEEPGDNNETFTKIDCGYDGHLYGSGSSPHPFVEQNYKDRYVYIATALNK
jgi:hypothetical protein